MLTEDENKNPIKLLAEIEAYLSFRLTGDAPTVPVEDMQKIHRDIGLCLEYNETSAKETANG